LEQSEDSTNLQSASADYITTTYSMHLNVLVLTQHLTYMLPTSLPVRLINLGNIYKAAQARLYTPIKIIMYKKLCKILNFS